MEDCQRFVKLAIEHSGRLDHLVNNAGVAKVDLFQDIQNLSGFTHIMDVNFWGTVYATRYAIPHLRKGKGKIIAVASTAGWYPLPSSAIYNASKAALISFYETLRCEINGDLGITIATPGLIRSDLTQNIPYAAKASMWFIPKQSKEACGRAIVESACRGDKYLVEPSWVGVLFPRKVLFPELMMEGFNHWCIVRGQQRTNEHKKKQSQPTTDSVPSPQLKSN